MEEVLDAALLLQQVTYGVAYLAEGCTETVEVLFERALQEVLNRRTEAKRRKEASLTPRERALIYKIRGRHFGYVAPCSRMPPTQLISSSSPQRARRIFRDGHWPYSEEGLWDGMLRLWRRKLRIIQELPDGPRASVTDEPEDDMEDRLLLGGGFKTFIDCLAENAQVQLNEAVKKIIQDETSVKMAVSSGQSFTAAFGLVTVPSGVLAELHPESQIIFEPPLPAEKLTAIKRLSIPRCGAPTHEKVLLRWPKSDNFVLKKLDPPGAALQFETTDPRCPQFVCFIAVG